MYIKQFALLGAIAAVSRLAVASPHPIVEATTNALFRRATVSPDNTCGSIGAGANNNYTCDATTNGPCCSASGWCGATTDYCGSGCQAGFGTCSESTTDPYECGKTNGKTCSDSQCCSINGYCGNTTDYCAAANCDSAFGVCNNGTSTPDSPNDDGRCGPDHSNKICENGECCSPSGYCGTTKDHCSSPDCLIGYGICDADTVPAGVSTANDARPELGSVPYGQDIYDCNSPGSVALTYDDGPYLYTNDMLDLLASYGFKATFFVTGINIGKGAIDDETTPWPAVLRRMIAEGHQIASHSWSHADLSKLNETQRQNEMVRNEMAIRNVIGKYPTYMRPPYSSCTAECMATMKRLGYHITYFDLDTQDYLHTTPDTNQISKDVVNGYLSDTTKTAANTDYLSIAHDIHDQTVHNLTNYMFSEMVKYGWKGVTAGACLGDAEANWYRSSSGSGSSSSSSSSLSTTATPTETPSVTTPITTPVTTPITTPVTTPTTPTTTTTSVAPTSTCTTTAVGSWCAKPITSFSTKVGCNLSALACNSDFARCVLTKGNSRAKCQSYKNTCNALENFCKKCTLLGRCRSADFKA